jgi:hypothetical protein
MKYKILNLALFIFLGLCGFSQTNKPNYYDSASNFIRKFIDLNLDYAKLDNISCAGGGLRLRMLEFKIDKNKKIYDVDIKNDSLKEMTQIFKNVLEKSEGKWDSKLVKLLQNKTIFLPLLNTSTTCISNEKITINREFKYTDSSSLIITDRDVRIALQKDLRDLITSFTNLFSNTNNAQYIAKAIILPIMFIMGDPRKRTTK